MGEDAQDIIRFLGPVSPNRPLNHDWQIDVYRSVTALTDLFRIYIHTVRVKLSVEDRMVGTTMVLNGYLIQEGVRFLWWVVDGAPSRVTVSHPSRGTRTCTVSGDPKLLARKLARELLSES
jgi:hypothetical protein